jgi:hypothetical protein
MKQPLHTITLEPWESLNLGTRVALEAATAMLWPLQPDDRLTVLITLLADEIEALTASASEVDAIIDVLRTQLKMTLVRPH